MGPLSLNSFYIFPKRNKDSDYDLERIGAHKGQHAELPGVGHTAHKGAQPDHTHAIDQAQRYQAAQTTPRGAVGAGAMREPTGGCSGHGEGPQVTGCRPDQSGGACRLSPVCFTS